eukprot:gene1394-2682_t
MSGIVDDVLEIRKKEIDAMVQISTILDTGLDRRMIAILLELIECGVHPEALADATPAKQNRRMFVYQKLNNPVLFTLYHNVEALDPPIYQ